MEPEDYNLHSVHIVSNFINFNLYLSEIMANLISFFKGDKIILRIEF